MNLSVKYLGLDLPSPIIISSSPFTGKADRILSLEEHGAGAVVLKSIFEEQILGESTFLDRFHDYPDAANYLHSYVGDEYIKEHLNLITEVKKRLTIPLIASINCLTTNNWIQYAKSIEAAGADALELNIFILPTDTKHKPQEIEDDYLKIVSKVVECVNIPVSVKLGIRFTSVIAIARDIFYRKAKGVVMFNRFFEPDVDINAIKIVQSPSLSERSELRNSLRTVAICSSELPALDIAVSTGVHTGEDAVKALLVGAKAAQVCTALYKEGPEVIGRMNNFISEWMKERNFKSIDEFRGRLSYKATGDEEMYERAQYMKFFPKE